MKLLTNIRITVLSFSVKVKGSTFYLCILYSGILLEVLKCIQNYDQTYK